MTFSWDKGFIRIRERQFDPAKYHFVAGYIVIGENANPYDCIRAAFYKTRGGIKAFCTLTIGSKYGVGISNGDLFEALYDAAVNTGLHLEGSRDTCQQLELILGGMFSDLSKGVKYHIINL